MPKPRKVARELSNLDSTLDAIASLPDEQVSTWGRRYDWTQPVECRQPAPRRSSHGAAAVIRTAADVLLRRRDRRLNALLLHPEMFDLDQKGQPNTLLHLLWEHADAIARPFVSEDALLSQAMETALAISDLDSAALFEQRLCAPNQFGAMNWLFVNMTVREQKVGLFDNHEPQPAFEAAVEFCERGVRRHARYFRKDYRHKIALFEIDHLAQWRHWMAVAALRLDAPRVFRHMHAALDHRCTKELVAAALGAGRWDALGSLCAAARANGMTAVGEWPLSPGQMPGRQYSSQGAANTQELAVEMLLGVFAAPEGWQAIACKALAGEFDLPNEPACSEAYLPALLARHASIWTPALQAAIDLRFPAATMQEMVALWQAQAPDPIWSARLATLSVRGEHALWTSLAPALPSTLASNTPSEGQIDRLGELLSRAPQAWDVVRSALGSRAASVEASMQRHLLHAATRPGLAAPRNRRM